MTARIAGPRLGAGLLIACFVVLLVPGSAAAHAELVRAVPADGETVTTPVTVVRARYSQDLAGNSRLDIKDETGSTVATGGIDPNDARRMVARPASPLAAGTFTVESTAVSAEDGDIERVTWTFSIRVIPTKSLPTPTVAPSASGEPSATATPAELPSPTARPSPTASPAPTTPTSGSNDVLLPIVAALAIVLIGAGFLLNRNRSPRV
jgi:methionine-rich copper-binding protein CopC